MDKNYAVIFKRVGFEEGKGCKLEPIGYVEGTEAVVNGVKCFIIDSSFRKYLLEDAVPNLDMESFLKANKKAKYMGDRSNFSIKYVYGSPLSSKVFKDLIAYNFSYLEAPFQIFGKELLEQSYNESVEKFKEQYVEALKQYNFYQLVGSEGKVNTIIQRKEPQFKGVAMNGVLPEIITEEIGFEIPKDYDFSGEVYKPLPTEIDSKNIFNEVKEYVKGQDIHIVPLLSAINDNLAAELPEEKVNILIVGPTGCGKTTVFERISNLLGIPCVIEDSTKFTKEGYYGRDIGEAFEDLIKAADGDIELAQIGVLGFDEMDKKTYGGKDDVGGISVIFSLLKALEGKEFTYQIRDGLSTQTRTFKTQNMTIVFMGAFSEIIEKAKGKVGFGREEENTVKKIYTIDNLVECGLPIEFKGRVQLLEVLEKLSKESLVEILKTAKVNALNMFIKKMRRYNTKVIVQDEYINLLAEQAYKNDTGARGLYEALIESTKIARSEIELLDKRIPKELVLSPEMIRDNTMYELKTAAKVRTLHR